MTAVAIKEEYTMEHKMRRRKIIFHHREASFALLN
jgi:hypothetical protein